MTSFLALHRYFIWADRMRVHFESMIEKKAKTEDFITLPYMSYYYAGMFVVIEGWKELGLNDPEIDRLLKSKNVDLLRRYRNGAFHFQKNYHDDRFVNFVKEKGVASWIIELREAFSQFFLNYFEQEKVQKV